MWPRCGKNSNLEKKCLLESPFTEMTYHVRGYMTFRLNELVSAMSMAYLSERGHIGHARGPWDGEECHEGRFSFRTTKSAFSIFRVPKWVFYEAATETRNQKLGITPHINSRPPGIRISSLVLLRQPSKVFFWILCKFLLIRLKRIYNFWCSMLVYASFALCFVTLYGVFLHFPELTY
jgi:hypothetical protein